MDFTKNYRGFKYGHVVVPNLFYHGILQRNYRKMTMKWFMVIFLYYDFLVKLYFYNMILLYHGLYLWTSNIVF